MVPSGHCIGSVVPHRRNTPPVSFQSFHITALPAHGYTRRGFPPRCPQRRCIPLRTPFRPQVRKDGLIIVVVSFALLASGIAGGLQLLEASLSPMHGTTSSSSGRTGGGTELRDVRRVLKKRRLPREPRVVEASRPASLVSGPGNRIQQGPRARQSECRLSPGRQDCVAFYDRRL